MNGLEFTGERFVPGQGGFQITYEHLHRYLFARSWARGKKVLDVASGTGYGASLLAQSAAAVWAVDLDAESIAYAKGLYERENLRFLRADVTRLPFQTGLMDLVVAMEVLEHVADPEGLVGETARVCRSDGSVLISTPNKASYSDARQYRNPYHVREFYRDEFLEMLNRHFGHVRLMHQHVRAGSLIAEDAASSGRSEIIASPASDPQKKMVEPMYFLAVCGVQAAPPVLTSQSAYLDVTDGLLQEWEQRIESANQEISRLNTEIERLGEWCKKLDAEVTERNVALRSLQDEMKSEIEGRDLRLGQLENEFDQRGQWALSLQGEVAEKDAIIAQANIDLSAAAAHLSRIRHALLYRILCRLRLLPD